MRPSNLYLLWFALIAEVSVSQLPMLALAPRVQLPIGGDGCTVAATAGYLTYMLTLQALYHFGCVVTPVHVCVCVFVRMGRERKGQRREREGEGVLSRLRKEGEGD